MSEIILVFFTALFLGIMTATVIISLLHGLAVFILEKIGIYKKGSLNVVTGDYITGAGYYRRGKMYMHRKDNGSEKIESGRVFLWLFIIFTLLFLLIGLFVVLYQNLL